MWYTKDLLGFVKENDGRFRIMARSVCNYYGLVGHINFEDVVQTLYLKFLSDHTLEKYDPIKGSIDSYLFGFLHTTVLMFFRKEHRRSGYVTHIPVCFDDAFPNEDRFEDRGALSVLDGQAADIERFREFLIKNEKYYKMTKSLRKKSGSYSRSKVFEYLEEGLTCTEIAEIFGCSVMFISYIKRDIAELLRKFGIINSST